MDEALLALEVADADADASPTVPFSPPEPLLPFLPAVGDGVAGSLIGFALSPKMAVSASGFELVGSLRT